MEPSRSSPLDIAASTPRARARGMLGALFAQAGIESAAIDARLLVCAALGLDHAALIRDPDAPMGGAASKLAAYAARRLAREPVSRILGRREFWGLDVAIGPAVLDPRPDTEILVEAVLAALGPRRRGPLRLLDLGTGSGAILCALLQECPRAFGVGLDRSPDAGRIAAANVRGLGFADRAAIVAGSWCDAMAGLFDVVVSNPPYVTSAELATLERDVRDHDPALALDGGVDGLDPYRAIVPRLTALLAPGGIAAFEAGPTQDAAVAAMFRAAGLRAVATRRDLAGRPRVTIGRWPVGRS